MASGHLFRKIRIAILSLILFFVAMNTWLTRARTTDWNNSLWMVIYPINGDGGETTQRYIDSLSVADFSDIESFVADQAKRYHVGISDPLTVQLAPQVHETPPTPPRNGSTFAIMLWSLRLRFWALWSDTYDGPDPDIRMFVVYHDPEYNHRLRHSLGIEKGMIGVVNAFASKSLAPRNNVVITHEFLHTVGATDKYDFATDLPLYPQGYAEPDRKPLYPQRLAEIMGGRIPLSVNSAVMPDSLARAAIGAETAQEIRWRR